MECLTYVYTCINTSTCPQDRISLRPDLVGGGGGGGGEQIIQWRQQRTTERRNDFFRATWASINAT